MKIGFFIDDTKFSVITHNDFHTVIHWFVKKIAESALFSIK